VSSHLIIIGRIFRKNSPKVLGVEYHQMLKTFVSDRPNQAFGAAFKARVRAMGIRDRPTSFRSPWQNGYVERPPWVGVVRWAMCLQCNRSDVPNELLTLIIGSA
jgi:hypothetical protein